MTQTQLSLLRNMVLFGRDGLGMINVFSSGNDGGPSFSPGFESFGNYDSASYNAFSNSRYTITVTGVDHDGQYKNADGTFTSYPEAGTSVLVAAPTGSNVAQNIGHDFGQGSGICTADSSATSASTQRRFRAGSMTTPSRHSWPIPTTTSRFNGTSAAAPIATGVIALMLEANPNLTLSRRAGDSRPQCPPECAAGDRFIRCVCKDLESTWQTNQIGPFQNPDPYDPAVSAFIQQEFPRTDPNNQGFFFGGGGQYAPDGNDGGRQFASRFESQPGLFTNGAGYTVSQGYGVYSEQIGYAHGVIDAELAVAMAKQWHTLGQNLDPFTEKTFYHVRGAARREHYRPRNGCRSITAAF